MFSKEFLNALKNINGYGDKVLLKYPVTVFNSAAKDVVATINAQSLGCEQFEDTGIYELSKFISMLSVIENAEVKRIGKKLVIQATTESASFNLCDLDLLEQYNLPVEVISNLDKFPSVSEFDLSANDLQTIKKAASILNELNALQIKGFNNNTEVSLSFHNRYISNANSFEKDYLGTANKEFQIKLAMENIQKLPVTDYSVKVKYNEEKDAYRVLFIASNFTILISKLAD